MTAINLFKTADAAILLTDQAMVSAGHLTLVRSKVIVAEHLAMAVAVAGNVTVRTMPLVENWLAVMGSQAVAMGAIGRLLEAVRSEAGRNGGHAEPQPAKLFVALWHPTLNRPECYIVDEAVVSVRHCDSPSSKEPFSMDRPALIKRIEDQRRLSNNVGAAAELTVVSASSITTEIIHRWPDNLGEPITPACASTSLG